MSSPPNVLNSFSSRYKDFCQTNDDNRSTERAGIGHIPGQHNIMSMSNSHAGGSGDPKLRCCCGRPECAYLEHNIEALVVLERQLERAAVVGQALLSRHETYVAESQQEHARMNAKIAGLENERTDLQRSNEKIVAENKELLSKLDTLNATYAQSDDTVHSLEALLRDTEVEVRRLNGLARRAEELEAQVQDLDLESSNLKRQLDDGETESRSTLTRWRESERKIKQLEREVEKIEWEAKREREQHEEVVTRLERERVLERELGGAEGRLKGAAALQGLESGTGGNVVSHFVKDILNDNASLQAGIVELRELLQSSNDEVQSLRQQIVHHQPIDSNEAQEPPLSQSVPLDQQLDWAQPSPEPPQREVHVHHHYHAKLAQKRDRPATVRRTSRRRVVVSNVASPMSSTPPTPTPKPQRMASSPIIPFHLHQPQPMAHRWSASTALSSNVSSIPSSPRSGFDRYGSIFDRLDTGEDSSRPTSPESAAEYHSPAIKPRLDSFEAVLEDDHEISESPVDVLVMDPGQPTLMAQDTTPSPSQLPKTNAGTITPQHKAPDFLLVPAYNRSEISTPQTQIHIDPPSPSTANIEIRPTLHRSSSHDSLLSISGMDIHLPKQHQQGAASLRIRGNQAHFAISPSVTTRGTLTSSTPVAGITDATAVSSKRSFSSDNQGASLRGLERVVGLPGARTEAKNASGLGRLMGGWVSRKWGVAPMKSVADLRSASSLMPRQQATQVAPSSPLAVPKRPTLASVLNGASENRIGSMGRTPGINQSGMIPGFFVPKEVVERPTKLEVKEGEVDEEGLRKALREGGSDGEE